MERRIRPIAYPGDVPVLHGVDVAIFNMSGEVGFVAVQVLPEPALPDAPLISCQTNGTQPLLLGQHLGKMSLYQPPADRKIGIIRWQRPDCMEVIRENDERVDSEWIVLPGCSDRLTQSNDVIDQQGLPPIQQIGGEEPTPAWDKCATVIRHTHEFNNSRWTPEVVDYAFGQSTLRSRRCGSPPDTVIKLKHSRSNRLAGRLAGGDRPPTVLTSAPCPSNSST